MENCQVTCVPLGGLADRRRLLGGHPQRREGETRRLLKTRVVSPRRVCVRRGLSNIINEGVLSLETGEIALAMGALEF